MSNKPLNKPVVKPNDAIVQEFDWGQLRWLANGKIGNSGDMTFGQCLIKPGCENPRHLHPNCEEILYVISGKIMHTLEDDVFEMGSGDTVVIPPNLMHNARNVGTETAVMMIAYSSPDRQTKGEF
jgi:quercetin dioxygenase-like cupin family protein